jgi:hypothetical protein
MTRSNIVSLIFILVFAGYIIFIFISRKNLEDKIKINGFFSLAIIKERVQGKSSSKDFIYEYFVKKKKIEGRDLMNYKFSKKYNVGDTILIKFLINDPNKSIIVKDFEYQSCYGLAPSDGWKTIPQCK